VAQIPLLVIILAAAILQMSVSIIAQADEGEATDMQMLYQNLDDNGLWVEVYGPVNPPLSEVVNYIVIVTSVQEKSNEGTGYVWDEGGAVYFAYPDSYVKTYPLSYFLVKQLIGGVTIHTQINIKNSIDYSEFIDLVGNTAISNMIGIPFLWETISITFPSMPTPPFDSAFCNDNDFDTLVIPFGHLVGEKEIKIDYLNQIGPDQALCFIIPTKFTNNMPTILRFFVATRHRGEPGERDLSPYNYRNTGEITVWVEPSRINDITLLYKFWL
jgi:hypothetical protein